MAIALPDCNSKGTANGTAAGGLEPCCPRLCLLAKQPPRPQEPPTVCPALVHTEHKFHCVLHSLPSSCRVQGAADLLHQARARPAKGQAGGRRLHLDGAAQVGSCACTLLMQTASLGGSRAAVLVAAAIICTEAQVEGSPARDILLR